MLEVSALERIDASFESLGKFYCEDIENIVHLQWKNLQDKSDTFFDTVM